MTRAWTRGGAWQDPGESYRYALWRRWDLARPRVCFVLLNPSTAGAAQDDPTIRRCLGFARRWGFGSLEVVNLFAWRSTDPAALRLVPDPIGPRNDRAIRRSAARARTVVVGWGEAGGLLGRDRDVTRLLSGRPLLCLGVTRRGRPRHPLYLRSDASPSVLVHSSGVSVDSARAWIDPVISAASAR